MENEPAFEWNEAKRQRNLETHGVDFAKACKLDWDAAISIEQNVAGEIRILSYAPMGKRLFAIVTTLRGTNIRVISFRKANQREVRKYAETKTR